MGQVSGVSVPADGSGTDAEILSGFPHAQKTERGTTVLDWQFFHFFVLRAIAREITARGRIPHDDFALASFRDP